MQPELSKTPAAEQAPGPLSRLWQRIRRFFRCYCGVDVDGDGEVDVEVAWDGNQAQYRVDVSAEGSEGA